MRMEQELREYAGQCCDVVLGTRADGSQYVRFETRPGYGNPTLERAQIEELLALMDKA